MKSYRNTIAFLCLILAPFATVMAQEAKPQQSVVITNANIFDGKNDKLATGSGQFSCFRPLPATKTQVFEYGEVHQKRTPRWQSRICYSTSWSRSSAPWSSIRWRGGSQARHGEGSPVRWKTDLFFFRNLMMQLPNAFRVLL